MPLDPIPGEDRARSLLLKALQQAEIEEHVGNPPVAPVNGTNVYWREAFGEIELQFYCLRPGAGRMKATISMLQMARRVMDFSYDDDSAVISTLVDVLDYLKATVSLTLTMTEVGIIKRAENLYLRSARSRERLHKGAISALFEQLTPAYSDYREASEKRLRGERDRRGGSQAKLPESERNTLHEQYDALHKHSKIVKKDYDAKLRDFAKRRKARGYSHKEWRDHWMKDSQNYPAEIQKYLEMFAEIDSPSASDIAYRILATQTGHTRKYVERLVLESRKAAKSPQ